MVRPHLLRLQRGVRIVVRRRAAEGGAGQGTSHLQPTVLMLDEPVGALDPGAAGPVGARALGSTAPNREACRRSMSPMTRRRPLPSPTASPSSPTGGDSSRIATRPDILWRAPANRVRGPIPRVRELQQTFGCDQGIGRQLNGVRSPNRFRQMAITAWSCDRTRVSLHPERRPHRRTVEATNVHRRSPFARHGLAASTA